MVGPEKDVCEACGEQVHRAGAIVRFAVLPEATQYFLPSWVVRGHSSL